MHSIRGRENQSFPRRTWGFMKIRWYDGRWVSNKSSNFQKVILCSLEFSLSVDFPRRYNSNLLPYIRLISCSAPNLRVQDSVRARLSHWCRHPGHMVCSSCEPAAETSGTFSSRLGQSWKDSCVQCWSLVPTQWFARLWGGDIIWSVLLVHLGRLPL